MTDLITENAYTKAFDGIKFATKLYHELPRKSFLPFVLFKRVKRFGSLDGWRAVAIFAVLFHHTLADSFASPIAQEGRHGVTLFFVISGFLIITLVLRSQDSPAGFTLWKFWGRRALRIFPIYYAILLFYVVAVHYAHRSDDGGQFFTNLPFFATFTTNWFVHATDSTTFFFSWSLAAEEQFYLVWPLIEVLVPRPLPKFILLALVALTSRIAAAYAGFDADGSLPIRMLADIPLGIALGTGLAHLLHHETSFRMAYRVLGRSGSAFGCLLFALIIAVISPFIGDAGEILVPIALLLMIASTVIREDHDLALLLQWKPVVWIGTVSYGMYMMHMLAVNIVRRAEPMFHVGSPVVLFIGSLGVAVALASLSFLYYERPFLALKDGLFRN